MISRIIFAVIVTILLWWGTYVNARRMYLDDNERKLAMLVSFILIGIGVGILYAS